MELQIHIQIEISSFHHFGNKDDEVLLMQTIFLWDLFLRDCSINLMLWNLTFIP